MFGINRFPREVAIEGHRFKLVYSLKELKEFMLKYNNQNQYTSLYAFNIINNKKPKYDTAIIDKVFFDIDLKTQQNEEINIIKQTLILYNFAIKHKYTFSLNFSGRGIHFYIYTKDIQLNNKKYALYNFSNFVKEQTQIPFDTTSFGDLARETRLLGSINRRSNKYVIPLTKEDLEKGIEYIQDLANNKIDLTQKYIIQNTLLDLKEWDTDKQQNRNIQQRDYNIKYETQKYNIKDNEMSLFIFNKFIEKFPCIKAIFENYGKDKKTAGYHQRTFILSFLKNHGFSSKFANDIIHKLLSNDNKGNSHCAQTHAYNFYRYNYNIPFCKSLKERGICPLLEQQKSKCYNKLNQFDIN